MNIPREYRIVGILAIGLVAMRMAILAVDAIAEAAERRALYR